MTNGAGLSDTNKHHWRGPVIYTMREADLDVPAGAEGVPLSNRTCRGRIYV